MTWYDYVAYFFAGLFLANSVPHFVHGISGKKFQSPFAKPPGVGESSPIVNVIWGLFNAVVGYALIFGVGRFTLGFTRPVLAAGLGAAIISVFLASHFGRVRRERGDDGGPVVKAKRPKGARP